MIARGIARELDWILSSLLVGWGLNRVKSAWQERNQQSMGCGPERKGVHGRGTAGRHDHYLIAEGSQTRHEVKDRKRPRYAIAFTLEVSVRAIAPAVDGRGKAKRAQRQFNRPYRRRPWP